MAERVNTPRCVLDEYLCLTLSSIVQSFNAPINEEHAWAVCYQTAKCLQTEWQTNANHCYVLVSMENIRIHKDGSVHGSSVRRQNKDTTRLPAPSEFKLVTSLGLVIYHALDYSLAEDEERPLSASLAQLIDRMTSADSIDQEDSSSDSNCDDTDRHEADEGIERDSGEDDGDPMDSRRHHGFSLAKVLEMCANHLPVPAQADSHYKAVCRALVAEALELSTFLEKISQGTEELKQLRKNAPDDSGNNVDLEKLHFTDWARLWVQVIRELRQGVKLKKVIDINPPPIEYELTPYEILMDDIRSRRYKLNKVMVNGDIPPRVKKDAHAIILEFIRSRPPLVPVSQRKLKPAPPKPSSPYEELMKSIRQEHKLKPTALNKTVETSRTKLDDSDATPQPTRRLIKADLSLLLTDNFDEDDEDSLASPIENGHAFDYDDGLKASACMEGSPKSPWQRTVALDLATQTASLKPERRHSITVCESPTKPQSEVSELAERSQPSSLPAQLTQDSCNHRSSNLQSPQWNNSMECLSLTLEEVVHIRNVLTKAELESLLVNKSLYQEVAKGKVCFTCKKTRFSFFGQWGQKCRLCKRTICERCCSKMRIPTEHFANVPVFTLSPSSSSSSEEESPKSMWRLRDPPAFFAKSVGSAPSSPNLPTKASHPPSSANGTPAGTPTGSQGAASKRRPLLRSRTLNRADSGRQEQLRGSLMSVCKDCRGMVRYVIVASRQSLNITQKRYHGNSSATQLNSTPAQTSSSTRDLHLNLSPIY